MEMSLSTTEGVVLGLVAFGERSGYELSRLAAKSVGHLWTPSQSQIYKTLPRLVSRRFARALVESTLEGQTLYRDAFRMLGVQKTETFNHIGQEVGVLV